MSDITKATIERLALANDASEQALGNIVSEFSQCATPEARKEFHRSLVSRFGGVKSMQDKSESVPDAVKPARRARGTKG